MVEQSILLKAALDTIKAVLRATTGPLRARKRRRLLSAVLKELLSLDPDLDLAEAQLQAAESTGAGPTRDLLHARRLMAGAAGHGAFRPARGKAASKGRAEKAGKAITTTRRKRAEGRRRRGHGAHRKRK
jgi:hypothetical protein